MKPGQVKIVNGEALARLFKLFANQVKCVVLSGCYSEVQARAIAQQINYVIGMKKAIDDKTAIKFAVGFYNALAAGRDFEFAYNLACCAIDMEGLEKELIPVLIKNPNIQENNTVIQKKLNEHDLQNLIKILQLSGRAKSARRNALCISIGINPKDINNFENTSEKECMRFQYL